MTEPMPPIEQRTPTEQQLKVAAELVQDETTTAQVYLPRITIKFCTQCKWMLRAAYFAQELLSTFNTSLGEVALIPTTGGVFTVTIYHSSPNNLTTQETRLWDRKENGGFPEIKLLKSLVRNVIDPSRDLGHTDRALKGVAKGSGTVPATAATVSVSTGVNTSTHHASGRDAGTQAGTRGAAGAENNDENNKMGREEVCEDCQ